MKKLIFAALILISACSPKQISYHGKAANTEDGAALNQNGRIIYVDALKEWPADMIGKETSVSGNLVSRHYGSTLKDDSDLEMVIEKPVWIAAK